MGIFRWTKTPKIISLELNYRIGSVRIRGLYSFFSSEGADSIRERTVSQSGLYIITILPVPTHT